jgi:peroxiredoxin
MLNNITSLLNGSVTKNLQRKALKKNDKAPLFTLPNINDECVQLETVLSEGKSILVFSGSTWYRYSPFPLLAWQEVFEQSDNQNTKILAIYPDKPDFAATKWKADHNIEILCDVGNKVAKQFGLVVKVSPDKAKKLPESITIDIISLTSEEETEVTMPAIYVVNKDRTILHVSFDASGYNCNSVKEILGVLT